MIVQTGLTWGKVWPKPQQLLYVTLPANFLWWKVLIDAEDRPKSITKRLQILKNHFICNKVNNTNDWSKGNNATRFTDQNKHHPCEPCSHFSLQFSSDTHLWYFTLQPFLIMQAAPDYHLYKFPEKCAQEGKMSLNDVKSQEHFNYDGTTIQQPPKNSFWLEKNKDKKENSEKWRSEGIDVCFYCSSICTWANVYLNRRWRTLCGFVPTLTCICVCRAVVCHCVCVCVCVCAVTKREIAG